LSVGEWLYASVISESGRVRREECEGMRDEEVKEGTVAVRTGHLLSELSEICMSKVLACSPLRISSSRRFPEPPPVSGCGEVIQARSDKCISQTLNKASNWGFKFSL